MRVALALVLFLSGVKLLEPPGANAIVIVVAAAGIVVGMSPRFAGRSGRRYPVAEPTPTDAAECRCGNGLRRRGAAAAGTPRTAGPVSR